VPEKYLLGLDIGTSSTKGILMNSSGDIVASHYSGHEVNIIKPGQMEQDPIRCYWNGFKVVVKEILKKSRIAPREIVGVGVSALSPSIVPIDRNGNPVRRAILYSDRRVTHECKELIENVGIEEIIKKTYNFPDPYFGGYKILWYKKAEEENYKKTWKILNAEKFVVFKLTGKAVIDKATASVYAPYFDMKSGRWTNDLASVIGGDIDVLPEEIYDSHEVVGYVTADASRETGLSPGTPVIACGPDSLMSSLSIGSIDDGDSALMYGSTSCWYVVTGRLLYEPRGRLLSSYYVVPNRYVLGGEMVTTGSILRWFCENFAHKEMELSRRIGKSPYELLDEEAEKVAPGSGGIIILPYFFGERTPIWNPDARGVIYGLTIAHNRAHIYRAILESVGYAIKQHIEIAKSLGIEVREIRATNGGAKSRLWRKIISDITGIKQLYSKKTLGAPMGDAFLTGVGVGVFRKFSDIRSLINDLEITSPDKELFELYNRFFEIYLEIYRATESYLDKLNRLTK